MLPCRLSLQLGIRTSLCTRLGAPTENLRDKNSRKYTGKTFSRIFRQGTSTCTLYMYMYWCIFTNKLAYDSLSPPPPPPPPPPSLGDGRVWRAAPGAGAAHPRVALAGLQEQGHQERAVLRLVPRGGRCVHQQVSPWLGTRPMHTLASLPVSFPVSMFISRSLCGLVPVPCTR